MTDKMHLHTRAFARAIQKFDADKLLARAKERAPDPTVFDEHDPFFWRAEISNRRIDSYVSRMGIQTLKNFARGADEGVSFQNSHNWEELGIGQSLNGVFIKADADDVDEDGVKIDRTEADFFTVRGIQLGRVNTDHFIAGVRSGLLKDVSVGFFASDLRCGICGEQIFNSWFGQYSDCDHIPGLKYAEVDENNEPIVVDGKAVMKTCYVEVMDGELAEVSQVFDGACPDAAIIKTQLLARDNKLTGQESQRFFQRFRVAPDGFTPSMVTGFDFLEGPIMAGRNPTKKAPVDETVIDELEPATPEELENRGVEDGADTTIIEDPEEDESTLEESEEDGEDESEEDGEVVDEFADTRAAALAIGITLASNPAKSVRSLIDHIAKLRPEARMGRKYKADMVEEAIKEGIRALGSTFNQAQYRKVLEGLDIDGIKLMRDDWTTQGNARLAGSTDSAGGRHTPMSPDEKKTEESGPPARAFKIVG